MTKTCIYIVPMLAVLAGGACSPAPISTPTEKQTTKKQTNAVKTGMATLPETHAAILDIIRSGDKAKLALDAKTMISAANNLSNIGAKPLGEQSPDLAKIWKTAALAIEPDVQDLPFRGRVKGPAYRKKTLAAGATEILQEIYYASEKAELSLQTLSGQTSAGQSLELSIIEQTETGGAKPVCTLSLQAEPASCQWLPLWTAKYNITITNHSQNPVPYLLVTN